MRIKPRRASRQSQPALLWVPPAGHHAAELRRLLLNGAPPLALARMHAEALDFLEMLRQVRDLKLRSIVQRLGCYLLALTQDAAASSAELLLAGAKGLLAPPPPARRGLAQYVMPSTANLPSIISNSDRLLIATEHSKADIPLSATSRHGPSVYFAR